MRISSPAFFYPAFRPGLERPGYWEKPPPGLQEDHWPLMHMYLEEATSPKKATMNILLLTAALLAALTTTALAAPNSSAKVASAKKTALICPVTGTKIASAAQAYSHEVYKGKTYYFCCPACKPSFDKNPGKVIASAAKGKYQPM